MLFPPIIYLPCTQIFLFSFSAFSISVYLSIRSNVDGPCFFWKKAAVCCFLTLPKANILTVALFAITNHYTTYPLLSNYLIPSVLSNYVALNFHHKLVLRMIECNFINSVNCFQFLSFSKPDWRWSLGQRNLSGLAELPHLTSCF